MSRIGKQPIPVPGTVQVKLGGSSVSVKGPLGELERTLPECVTIERKGEELLLSVDLSRPGARALYGMARARVANMVTGVQTGFSKTLEIVGLGFKAIPEGEKLKLIIGFSHPVEFSIPKGIKIEVDKKQTTLVLRGADKDLVGQTAARLRGLKEPEPYKGSGIKYQGERILRKAGKTAAGAGAGGGAKK